MCTCVLHNCVCVHLCVGTCVLQPACCVHLCVATCVLQPATCVHLCAATSVLQPVPLSNAATCVLQPVPLSNQLCAITPCMSCVPNFMYIVQAWGRTTRYGLASFKDVQLRSAIEQQLPMTEFKQFLCEDVVHHGREGSMVAPGTAEDYCATMREFFGYLVHLQNLSMPSFEHAADPDLVTRFVVFKQHRMRSNIRQQLKSLIYTFIRAVNFMQYTAKVRMDGLHDAVCAIAFTPCMCVPSFMCGGGCNHLNDSNGLAAMMEWQQAAAHVGCMHEEVVSDCQSVPALVD